MAKQEKKPALDMFSLGNVTPQERLVAVPTKNGAKKKRAGMQLRILPIMIIAAVLFLTVRANEAWKDFSIGQLYAQQPPASQSATPAAPPAPAPARAPTPVQGVPAAQSTAPAARPSRGGIGDRKWRSGAPACARASSRAWRNSAPEAPQAGSQGR